MKAQKGHPPQINHWNRSQWVSFHTYQEKIQSIYAHLPPGGVLAIGQHLVAENQIEQRARQIWLAGNNRPEDTLNNWLKAEREVIGNLFAALSSQDKKESESSAT